MVKLHEADVGVCGRGWRVFGVGCVCGLTVSAVLLACVFVRPGV